MNRFSTSMTLIALSFGLHTAQAAVPQDLPTAVVRYADLDLSHPAGVDRLYVRLRQAASLVCNPSDTQGVRAQVSYRACAERALDDAVATVNDPNLTALHTRGRSG